MLKSVSYDKEFTMRGVYSREFAMLHEFHGSKKKTMCIEYDSVLSAKRATAMVRRYIERNRMPLAAAHRQTFVFVFRKEKEECISE